MTGKIIPNEVRTIEDLVRWIIDMERDVVAFQEAYLGRKRELPSKKCPSPSG
ncbi:hypothetical protein LCGC14_0327500 [marine sediment metagenome]|uniref:Uncharacterized protein n=1 Tax=marine sediment metagenome TaxID=412755 RepID=A0A0F9WPK9_9ZZZZ